MKLKINEIFDSMQGEGMDSGKLAIFVRMSGCNRKCKFCDTEHESFTEMELPQILDVIMELSMGKIMNVVFTGGEPLLQDIAPLVNQLYHDYKFRLGLETNGTIGIDNSFRNMFSSISVSPKVARHRLAIDSCDSLKLLFPYLPGADYRSFMTYDAKWKGLQPIAVGNELADQQMMLATLKELQSLPSEWRLSPQTHKLLRLP